MRRNSSVFFRAGLIAAMLLVSQARRAHATAEICGNSIDDDGNGLTDEGCYPSLTTGVCESPLSCGDTGMVSWSTGSLHYDLPPDIAPAVPYGPGIGFRRFYTSQYSPTGANPTTVNHTPLGSNWQHTYMTWLYAFNDGTTNRIVLHTSQGRDVYYTDASTTCSGSFSGFEKYTPQAGDHVIALCVDTTNTLYYLQLLTGEVLKYNSSGQIIEIWDTMPTPNKVLITWTSTSNGNVSTVTDASGERQLVFGYTNNLLTQIQFETKSPTGGWTVQHTTTYDYTNSVTRDATSQWFVPQNTTEWTNLLQGTDIPNPTNMWKCQEAASPPDQALQDSIGTTSLTATDAGGMSYSQSVTGWSRKAVTLTENQTSHWASGSGWCNPKTTKCTAFGLVQTALPTAQRDLFSVGDTNGVRADVWPQTILRHTYDYPVEVWNGTSTIANGSIGSTVVPWVVSADPVNDFTTLTAGSVVATPTWATGTSANGTLTVGKNGLNSAAASYLYMAGWSGSALTAAQQTTLTSRIMNGPGLSSVTIGGQLAQKYTYNDAGFLTKITDGAGKQVVAFAYSATNSGEVDQIATSRGTVGFEYSTSRTGCTAGNTVLYFNLGNTTNCSADADCGSGYMCGGKTGSGTTGKCFLAARCLTKSTVNGESVITNVAPLGPGGGSCTGACTDVMAYSWTASGSGNVNVIGREDPLSNFTAISYNSNGLPQQAWYGATDSSGTSANRTVYYFYDSTFPGRIAEVRRASDISPNASSCSSSSTTGCDRILYCFGSSCSASCNNDNQLCTIEHDGFTLDATATPTTFASKITYVHDSVGRISEIDGAVSGIKTVFEFNTGGNGLVSDNFLKDYKAYTDATHYLEPQFTTYDFWGNPTTLEAPDGNYTCDTYDAARGFLHIRKRATDGTSTCTTALTTQWDRDSWLRLADVVRPDGSYLIFTWDGTGRLSEVQRSDDGKSAADNQIFTYTADSQVSEVDTFSSTDSVHPTAKQPYTYFASRRLQEIVNPVSPSNFTGLVYDSAGKVTEVDGAGSLAKTVYHFDTSSAPGRDSRVTSEERYKTSSTSDTWTLLYAWMGDQSQVTDGDSKVTGSTRDDMSRIVKITSPDLAGPTVRVYDAASRLTTLVEDEGGGGNQETHTFTYDYMGRRLVDDYQGSCSNGASPHAEIQRTYDALPSGVPCPMTGGCNNLMGRIAYVDTILMCSSLYNGTDGSLDQFTFYSYDDAGRLIEEYVKDDSNRTADTKYEYTPNGALSKVTTPSNAVIGWTYDDNTSNSNMDLVTQVYRTDKSTLIADAIKYEPFGPWTGYKWEASIGGTQLQNTVDRNLAYRITAVHGALQGSTENAKVAITEDAMGRVTSRVYTPHDPTLAGLFDSYFTYDEQSRVVCEATTSGTCPTSGSTLKNNHDLSVPFMSAGDWKEILRPIPGSTGVVNNFNTSGTNYGTSHQVTDINQSDGTPAFGHTAIAYDARGLRSYDDNTTSLTHDRRDYTYDARRNVINVRGQYYTGSAWHYYDVASAFDYKNRRVFKSFYDETTVKTAQWFFYYDAEDRLTEVQYTPDTSVTGTYSYFQLAWLGTKLVLYWQSDFVGGLSSGTSKRYVASDETDRPIQLWNWPSSGDATRVWAVNQSAWGVDKNIVGTTVFQPLLFAGQYNDIETRAYEDDGATVHRPGICDNRFRTFDPFAGIYLQVDPLVEKTWSSYIYVESDPVGKTDPVGQDWCLCDPEQQQCNCISIDPGGGDNGDGTGTGSGKPWVDCESICQGWDKGWYSTDDLKRAGCDCPAPEQCEADDEYGSITTTCYPTGHDPKPARTTTGHCKDWGLVDNNLSGCEPCKAGCRNNPDICKKKQVGDDTVTVCDEGKLADCLECTCFNACKACKGIPKPLDCSANARNRMDPRSAEAAP